MGENRNFRKTTATKFSQSSKLTQPFYSVSEASRLLGKSDDTILRWCKTGKLLCVHQKYGSKFSYKIPSVSIQNWLDEQATQNELQASLKKAARLKSKSEPQENLLEKFKKACLQGVITGKPFSHFTVRYYGDHMKGFFAQYSKLSYKTLKDYLLNVPVDQFATRDKLHKAAVCFAKFLVIEEQADESLIEELRPLKPKRHKPPKRKIVDENGLQKMIQACDSKLEDLLIVKMLAYTGLRASEYGALKVEDIDLEKRTLTVQCGKGGKSRKVGLTNDLTSLTQSYINKFQRSPSDFLHPDSKGRQMTKDGVYQRIRRIGDKAKVPTASHTLRRYFVTMNANKGRSLVMIQMACGHADIKTTRDYCMTAETEMIKAMQSWD